jgi:hypothetical protein
MSNRGFEDLTAVKIPMLVFPVLTVDTIRRNILPPSSGGSMLFETLISAYISTGRYNPAYNIVQQKVRKSENFTAPRSCKHL